MFTYIHIECQTNPELSSMLNTLSLLTAALYVILYIYSTVGRSIADTSDPR